MDAGAVARAARGLPLALGIGATAALAARTLWSRATRCWRTLLARVSPAVAEAIDS